MTNAVLVLALVIGALSTGLVLLAVWRRRNPTPPTIDECEADVARAGDSMAKLVEIAGIDERDKDAVPSAIKEMEAGIDVSADQESDQQHSLVAEASEEPREVIGRDDAHIRTVDSLDTPSAEERQPTVQDERPTEEDLVTIPTTVPVYRPPTPPLPVSAPRATRAPPTRRPDSLDSELRVRVQLVFDQYGDVRTIALVPDRREGMPSEVEITGTNGELCLAEFRDDCYEPVPLADSGVTLRQGVVWRGLREARRWRWVLSSRELYALGRGEEWGLHGFVSTARLRMNACHVVLATSQLREEVLVALGAAGCTTLEVNDDTVPGVPAGWLLFRNVTPTRAVQMKDNADILNVLCPQPDIEAHFLGGIRLHQRTWLAGYPPRIRFTGECGDSFRVMIGGQDAEPAADGAFEGPGWDTAGEHRLWFDGQSITYAIRVMDEGWNYWRANDFGTGAVICGAGTYGLDEKRWHHVRVPVTNRLLVGARPGQVVHCRLRTAVRCETLLALVPFAPVWALPCDPAHVDKRSARIMQLHRTEPVVSMKVPSGHRACKREVVMWIGAIDAAGRKQLAFAATSDDTVALWRRYRAVAKQLRRKLR